MCSVNFWDGWMASLLDGRESEWTPGVCDGQGGLACCDSWGRKESDRTEQLNWTEMKFWFLISQIFKTSLPFLLFVYCLQVFFSHITWRKSLLLCFLLPSAEYLRTMLFLTSYRSLSPLFLIIIILLYYLSSTIIKSLLNTYFKIFLKNHNKLQYCMIYTKPEITYQTFVSCWPTAAAAKLLPVVSDSVRPNRWHPTRLPHPWDSPGKNTGMGRHFLLQCMKVKSESEV